MPTTFPANTYPHMVVNTSGIVHYMRLGDSNVNQSGDDADGLFGSGANCATGASAVAGDTNASRRFNGSNAYISYGNTNSLTGNFTLELWVYPLTNYTSGFPTILSKENWGDATYQASGWSFYIEGRSSGNGGMRAAFSRHGYNGITRVYGLNNLPVNAWTHLAATYDGSTLRMYQNGTLTWDVPSLNSMNTSHYPFVVGCASNYQPSAFSDWFNGNVDELAIYNRALSGTELTNHYERALTPPNINTYLSSTDRDTISETRTKTQTGTMSLTETRTLGRVETYSAVRAHEGADVGNFAVTESVDEIITEFMGDKLFLSDSVALTTTETVSSSTEAGFSDDVQMLEDVPLLSIFSQASLSDENGVFGARLDFFVLDLDRLGLNPYIGPALNSVEDIAAYNVTESYNFGKIYRERVGLLHEAVYQRFPNAVQIEYPHDTIVRIGLPEDDFFVVVGREGELVALGRITTTWEGPFLAMRRQYIQDDPFIASTNANTVIEFFRNPYEHPEILSLFDLPVQRIG